MIYFFVVVLVLVILIAILSGGIALGRYYGKRKLANHPDHKLAVDRIAESAVFGLLALLIAFSFSGAYERLERRKMHVLNEANVFNTAYDYTDLVSKKHQPIMRKYIKLYLDLHLSAYKNIPYLDKVQQDLDAAEEIEHKLWQASVAACEDNSNKSLFILVIPAIDEMFRVSESGINLARIHPPGIIFMLLIGLSTAGAFLIGYNSAKSKKNIPVHIACYVLFMAFTIYIVVNIEFPRAGFIRLNYFDRILLDVRDNMNPVKKTKDNTYWMLSILR